MSQLERAYLMVGEDLLKQEVALNRLVERAQNEGASEFDIDRHDASESFNLDQIETSLQMFPMLSPYRLIIIENVEKGGAALTKVLNEYLANPSSQIVLALTAKKLNAASKLYKSVKSLGKTTIIDCSPVRRREVPDQVRKLAAQKGLSIEQRAVTELISRIGQSAQDLNAEIDKLALAVDESNKITYDLVQELVVRSVEVKPWDVLDAISARNAKEFVVLYERMPSQSPLGMLQMTLTRLRQLLTAKALVNRGQSAQLASTLKLQEWQVKHHHHWAQSWKISDLISALKTGADAELAMKTGSDQRALYRQWVLSIFNSF